MPTVPLSNPTEPCSLHWCKPAAWLNDLRCCEGCAVSCHACACLKTGSYSPAALLQACCLSCRPGAGLNPLQEWIHAGALTRPLQEWKHAGALQLPH